jgi:heme oxygenase (biliverdin-producing, ferredoxin)
MRGLLGFQAAVMLAILSGSATAFLQDVVPVTTGRNNHDRSMTSPVILKSATNPTNTIEETMALDVTSVSLNSNPRQSGLALQLDEGTRKSHSMAENTAFVTGFFKGISKPESYRNLLTSLYYVYDVMEQTLDNTSDERVKLLDDQALRRVDALQQDMQYFYGKSGDYDNWKTSLPAPTPATQRYVTRIQEIGNNPDLSHLLVAHQYTRYLGDLFGGQMMGGMATKSMNLPQDGSGVAFYKFDGIDSTQKYITDWYRRLNSLKLTESQKQEIVDEANLVFELNIGILEELEGSPLAALWTMAISTLREKLGFSS